ncbi:chromate transporter [Miniphocaeibacter halophilus]|uniref:Chromate transporter n=1 Tax=Miniphocaeibacter halophilus TaxID=2931922 RepID=A0AC61MQE9_9FIRM|nr:chromate transporter [Miniphocaeibacter halophilus]QQK07910.1 chromate transporter [Miniphocaeibacter halophilus]
MIFLKLFFTFFKIGLFSFGGGYAMIPLILQEIVNTNGWIEKIDLINMISISQVTPGPIAINIATFVGYVISGVRGSLVATISVILPSVILVTIMFFFIKKFKGNIYLEWFLKGIRVVVVGLIGAGFLSIFLEGVNNVFAVIVFTVSFYLVAFKKVHPIPVIVVAGILGAVVS